MSYGHAAFLAAKPTWLAEAWAEARADAPTPATLGEESRVAERGVDFPPAPRSVGGASS